MGILDYTPIGAISKGLTGKSIDESDEVHYTPTPLDQNTQGLIDDQYKRSLQSPEQAIANRKSIVGSSPNMMSMPHDETSLGMSGTGGLSKAIFARQAKRHGENLHKLNTHQELAGTRDYFNNQETAFNAQLAAQKVKNRNNEMLWKASAANAEARAAVMRNLLGVGGMLAGAAIAGPAGAAVGSQVGGMAGGKPADPSTFEANKTSVSESFKGGGGGPTESVDYNDNSYMPRMGKGDQGF